jgi:mono/diheme cytochrome c family protein
LKKEHRKSHAPLQDEKIRLSAVTASAVLFAASCLPAAAQDQFTPEQIKQGSDMYSRNCAPCHGPQMRDPEGAFDLRKFPPEQKDRFVNSVTKGKNTMPPWGGVFSAADIDALWAYVMAGEKR